MSPNRSPSIPELSFERKAPFGDMVARRIIIDESYKSWLIARAQSASQRIQGLGRETGTLASTIERLILFLNLTGLDGESQELELARHRAVQAAAGN